jgi:hypothetical protein
MWLPKLKIQSLANNRIPRWLILSILFIICISPIHATHAQENAHVYLSLVLKDNDFSWNWQSPSEITLSPPPFHLPMALLDHAGRLHIFWDTLTTPQFIYHIIKTDSGWTDPTPVAESLGVSSTLYPPILDTLGSIHLLWRNDLGFGIDQHNRLLYSQFDGVQWSPEEEVVKASNELNGMLQFDDQGNIFVTYQDSWGVVAYQTVRSPTGWSTPVTITPAFWPTLVWPDMHGGIHFFADWSSGTLDYAYWYGGIFQVQGQTFPGELIGHSSQLDLANNLHTYWTSLVPVPGGTVNGIYHRCLKPDLTWGTQTNPSGQADVGSGPVKAWDGGSQFGILWEESQSQQMRLAIWQGCEQAEQRIVPFDTEINREASALAISVTPNKVCALSRKLFTYTYTAWCATINR